MREANKFKWRGLAWDDEPDELNDLKERLERKKAELEVVDDEGLFFELYDQEPWDFIILDIFDSNHVRLGPQIAARIRQLNKNIPIIFLTNDERIIINNDINTEEPSLVKSKLITQGILAYDIIKYIKSVTYDYSKVFIIYGHGKKAEGFKEKVVNKLEKHKIDPILLSPEQVMESIGMGLVDKMKPCGAFIAICTPDDKVSDDWYQPRQNVLLEIGMAMGFSEGFKRLVILQRWGAKPESQAKLPSDLGGVLPLRFYDEQEPVLDKMMNALKERNINVKSSE